MQVPALLLGLPEDERLALLSSWQAGRAQLETSLAHVLTATPAGGAGDGAAVPMAVDEGSGEAGAASGGSGGAVSLPPDLMLKVAQASQDLLGLAGDPVLAALKNSGKRNVSAREQQQVWRMMRDVILEEWVAVPMELLPLSVRPLVSDGRKRMWWGGW